jgi:integrase
MARRRSQGSGTVRLLPSGRWNVRYRDDLGKQRVGGTFASKVDALGWLANREQTRRDPEIVQAERSDPTVAAYSNAWLAGRTTLKPRTREDYRRLLDTAILPSLGDLRLSALSKATVRRWYDGLDPDKATNRSHSYGLLRTIMKDAIRDDLITTNPVDIRDASRARKRHQTQVATLAELQAIVEHVPDRYRLMIMLASWCALRYGEIIELRREDVTAASVRVTRGVVRVGGTYAIGDPKSAAGRRAVAIPPHMAGMVGHHLAEHTGPEASALLFPAAGDPRKHLAPSSFYKIYYPAREAAGRPDLRFHDLRHTGATLAAATGATLAQLMNRLGHSTAGAAMIYQHATDDADRLIADRLSAIAAGG